MIGRDRACALDLDPVQPQQTRELTRRDTALGRDLRHASEQSLTPVLRLPGDMRLKLSPSALVIDDHRPPTRQPLMTLIPPPFAYSNAFSGRSDVKVKGICRVSRSVP
jgi:hypothetical protein